MFRSVVAAGGTVFVFVFVSWAGCTTRNPAICCTTQEDCDQARLPAPTPCGDALVCLSNACQVPPTCQADSDCSGTLVCDVPDGACAECVDSSTCGDRVCDAVAHSCRSCEADSECGGGFCATSTMTCRSSIVPRYVPHTCDDRSESDLSITADTLIDTSDASVCTGGVVVQSGPEICVVRGRTIFVQGGVTLSVRGPRAVALVADTTATIDGTFDLDATFIVNGPGGGTIIAGGAPRSDAGGGGAGFATNGGAGATTDIGGGADNAGASVDAPESELVGGPRADGVAGGGGGGAATIIACRGSVTVTGVLSANGGGAGQAPIGLAGAGGGAGGYVALQGRAVSMTGRAYANGGSGGSGASTTVLGLAGSDGPRSSTACASARGTGGAGGCLAKKPDDGGPGIEFPPGGGGGSVGFLSVFTLLGGATISPGAASPAFLHAITIETR